MKQVDCLSKVMFSISKEGKLERQGKNPRLIHIMEEEEDDGDEDNKPLSKIISVGVPGDEPWMQFRIDFIDTTKQGQVSSKLTKSTSEEKTVTPSPLLWTKRPTTAKAMTNINSKSNESSAIPPSSPSSVFSPEWCFPATKAAIKMRRSNASSSPEQQRKRPRILAFPEEQKQPATTTSTSKKTDNGRLAVTGTASKSNNRHICRSSNTTPTASSSPPTPRRQNRSPLKKRPSRAPPLSSPLDDDHSTEDDKNCNKDGDSSSQQSHQEVDSPPFAIRRPLQERNTDSLYVRQQQGHPFFNGSTKRKLCLPTTTTTEEEDHAQTDSSLLAVVHQGDISTTINNNANNIQHALSALSDQSINENDDGGEGRADDNHAVDGDRDDRGNDKDEHTNRKVGQIKNDGDTEMAGKEPNGNKPAISAAPHQNRAQLSLKDGHQKIGCTTTINITDNDRSNNRHTTPTQLQVQVPTKSGDEQRQQEQLQRGKGTSDIESLRGDEVNATDARPMVYSQEDVMVSQPGSQYAQTQEKSQAEDFAAVGIGEERPSQGTQLFCQQDSHDSDESRDDDLVTKTTKSQSQASDASDSGFQDSQPRFALPSISFQHLSLSSETQVSHSQHPRASFASQILDNGKAREETNSNDSTSCDSVIVSQNQSQPCRKASLSDSESKFEIGVKSQLYSEGNLPVERSQALAQREVKENATHHSALQICSSNQSDSSSQVSSVLYLPMYDNQFSTQSSLVLMEEKAAAIQEQQQQCRSSSNGTSTDGAGELSAHWQMLQKTNAGRSKASRALVNLVVERNRQKGATSSFWLPSILDDC